MSISLLVFFSWDLETAKITKKTANEVNLLSETIVVVPVAKTTSHPDSRSEGLISESKSAVKTEQPKTVDPLAAVKSYQATLKNAAAPTSAPTASPTLQGAPHQDAAKFFEDAIRATNPPAPSSLMNPFGKP